MITCSLVKASKQGIKVSLSCFYYNLPLSEEWPYVLSPCVPAFWAAEHKIPIK